MNKWLVGQRNGLRKNALSFRTNVRKLKYSIVREVSSHSKWGNRVWREKETVYVDKEILNMIKRKIEIISYIILGLLILGFIMTFWEFPGFIGENEMELFDIVPMNYAFCLGILICGTLIFLRLKYKIDIFGSRTKNPDIKFFANIIIYPILSIGLGYMTLFNIYSLSNYCFISGKQTLSGEIYKMDITEESKGHDKFYICFNEKMKYRLRVSEENYSKYKEGDKINVKVYKGRFYGYYLVDKNEFKY